MEEIQQYYIEYDKEGKYTCQKYKVVDTIIFENEEFERFKSGFCQACDFLDINYICLFDYLFISS